MAGHPGTWYFSAKSVTFANVGKGTHQFGHDDDLGENPAEAAGPDHLLTGASGHPRYTALASCPGG